MRGRRKLHAIVVGSCLLALGACNDPPPRAPTPPRELVPPVALSGNLEEAVADPALGKPDAWYEAYSAYMTREFQREYLTTPETERFERFGLRLLDYQLREDLLREHQDDLTRDEQDTYRRLPSADECRRFIHEHEPPPAVAPTGSATRGEEHR